MKFLAGTGKILAVGVSNDSASQFDLLKSRMEQPLVTNQIEFHLLHPEPIDDGTLHQCEKLGVHPMAWSPLAGGRIFDPTDVAAGRLVAAAKYISSRYNGLPLDQLAYSWILRTESTACCHRHETSSTRLQSACAGRRHRVGT